VVDLYVRQQGQIRNVSKAVGLHGPGVARRRRTTTTTTTL
jgi:hypothetical protein